ncbi:MAG: zinc-binding dehydrogenase, partial [Spirochaetia bacterium]
MTQFGGYSSVVAAPAIQFFRMPAEMTYQVAATIPVSYFTAYLTIVRQCNLQPDERILIHNAGGGVGVAAIQLATQIGAQVFGTASSWKHDRLRELGADQLVDYRKTDWVAEINRLTGGPAMHVVIDPVGGRNLKRDFEVMAPLARLAAFGFSEPVRSGDRGLLPTLRSLYGMPRFKMTTLFAHNWSVSGLNMARLWTEFDRLRTIGPEVIAAWEQGFVKPEIAAVFPFDKASDAHRMLDERRNLGKVLLLP